MAGFLSMFDKLDDIIYEPVKVVCDYTRRPLDKWEQARREEQRQREFEREEEMSRRAFEQNEKAKQAQFEREQEAEERQVERDIRRETGIQDTIAKLEEFRKDKEVERRKELAEAALKYQETLMQISEEALEGLGNMRVDLQRRAEELSSEMYERYNEMQNRALSNANDQALQIQENFADNPATQDIMMQGVSGQIANSIDMARQFMERLNEALRSINQDLSLLSKAGHENVMNSTRALHQGAAGQHGALKSKEDMPRIREADYDELD